MKRYLVFGLIISLLFHWSFLPLVYAENLEEVSEDIETLDLPVTFPEGDSELILGGENSSEIDESSSETEENLEASDSDLPDLPEEESGENVDSDSSSENPNSDDEASDSEVEDDSDPVEDDSIADSDESLEEGDEPMDNEEVSTADSDKQTHESESETDSLGESEDGVGETEDQNDPEEDLIEGELDPDSEVLHTHELIINEVMIGSELNEEKDVWIEFYNPGTDPILLDDWEIKGVTKGNGWVQLVNEADLFIEPDQYFVYSRYSNSSSSVQLNKPDFTRSNLVLPSLENIHIELRNPDGNISDEFKVKDHKNERPFRAYERACIDEWGFKNEWHLSVVQVNLKKTMIRSFGSPGASNGICKTMEDFEGQEDSRDPTETEESSETDEDLSENAVMIPDTGLINEILVNPEGSDADGEWVELFNSSDVDIDLSGWFLDDAEGASSPYLLDFILPQKSYVLVGGSDLKLTFKNSADQVRLLNSNLEVIEQIDYSEAKEEWSYAKNDSGQFVWTPLVTPESLNDFPPPPKRYFGQQVRLHKVLPNPDGTDSGREKVVLRSNVSDLISLAGWSIQNQKGKVFVFEEGLVLPDEDYKFNPKVIDLSLKNSSEKLTLKDSWGTVIDEINWEEARSGQWVYRQDYFKSEMKVRVNRVIDGDTFEIEYDGQNWKVRLLGIDSPESVHPDRPAEPFGEEAKVYLKSLLDGKHVTLIFEDRLMDTYDRLLAYAYVDKLFVNRDLLEKGLADFYDEFYFSQRSYFAHYRSLARDKNLGIWSINSKDSSKNSKSSLTTTENIPVNLPEDLTPKEALNCLGSKLSLHSFLPDPADGEEEFISIVSQSDNACFYGWKIDDVLDGGSKPFLIEEKSRLELDEVFQFKKSKTKITLNNSDDCVYLIDPSGEIADQLCYEKTEKGKVIDRFSSSFKSSNIESEKDSDSNERSDLPLQVDKVKPLACPNSGIKIQSILPNEEKGKTVEFIQLINTTDQEVCLDGWLLDDVLEGGSKPYALTGEYIVSDSTLSLEKGLTKISLNNGNDCASLLNPKGDLVDQICYQKTRKGQIITHETDTRSTAVSKKSTPKKSSSQSSSTKFHREARNFRWDLKNQTLNGKVDYIFEEGQMIYLKTDDQKTIPVSYANSNIDIRMTKQMVDLGKPIALEIRSGSKQNELIAIQPLLNLKTSSISDDSVHAEVVSPSSRLPKVGFEWGYLILLVAVVGGGFYLSGLAPVRFNVKRISRRRKRRRI